MHIDPIPLPFIGTLLSLNNHECKSWDRILRRDRDLGDGCREVVLGNYLEYNVNYRINNVKPFTRINLQ